MKINTSFRLRGIPQNEALFCTGATKISGAQKLAVQKKSKGCFRAQRAGQFPPEVILRVDRCALGAKERKLGSQNH